VVKETGWGWGLKEGRCTVVCAAAALPARWLKSACIVCVCVYCVCVLCGCWRKREVLGACERHTHAGVQAADARPLRPSRLGRPAAMMTADDHSG